MSWNFGGVVDEYGPIEKDTPSVRKLEPGDHPQQRRLARTRGAYDSDAASRWNR
jgi:hypothetical protein